MIDIIRNTFSSIKTRNLNASIMLLLAKTLGEITSDQVKFAEIVELVDFGGALHSSIQDSSENLSFFQSLIGNKGLILGGDYLISTA